MGGGVTATPPQPTEVYLNICIEQSCFVYVQMGMHKSEAEFAAAISLSQMHTQSFYPLQEEHEKNHGRGEADKSLLVSPEEEPGSSGHKKHHKKAKGKKCDNKPWTVVAECLC